MFLFAVMSFGNDVEMNAVRILIAFMVLEDLKALDPPEWPSYLHFRHMHNPSIDYLVLLIKPCCVPYPNDERSNFQLNISSKLRKKLEAAERRHEQQTESDCEALAKFFLDQWPCPEPMTEGFSTPPLIDLPQALEVIRPEWLRLFQNMQLSHYVERVQHVLDRRCTEEKIESPRLRTKDQECFRQDATITISLHSLKICCRNCPVMPRERCPSVANGDVRPPPIRTTELFVRSPKGEFPADYTKACTREEYSIALLLGDTGT